MDFALTAEQQQLQDEAIRFARTTLVRDDRIERDRDARFDREAWMQCAGFGVLGLPVAREHGGAGLGPTSVLAVMEGLGYAARDQGLLFAIHSHLGSHVMPLVQHGSEAQQRRYLPSLCDGTRIGAQGIRETASGDLVATVRAEACEGGYVLDGTQPQVRNAPVADGFVVYATTDPSRGPAGITAFVLGRDTPGLTVGAPIGTMGLRTGPMADVHFARCFVPDEARLGAEGGGVEVYQHAADREHGSMAAMALGAMRALLERCIEHAQQRRQSGRPIGRFGSVANRIVEMHVRLATCRPLVYTVGWLEEQGRPIRTEAAVARWHVSECYVQSCLDAVQVFGGYGYMSETGIERSLRDAIGWRIVPGTIEAQRMRIARDLGL